MASYIIIIGIYITFPINLSTNIIGKNLSLITVISASIINPLYEEIFLIGYIITFFKKSKGLFYGMIISLTIRTALHLYQGPQVFSVIVIGSVFLLWYVKKKTLWPIIFAHMLFDFTGLYHLM